MHDRTDPRRDMARPEVQLEIDGIPAELPLRVRVDEGDLEPFRIPQLARSIARAGAASGTFGEDMALGVARAVGIYLLRSTEGDVVGPKAISASVVDVLREMGYRSGAEHYRRVYAAPLRSDTSDRAERPGPVEGDIESVLLDGHSNPDAIEHALAESSTQAYALEHLVTRSAAAAFRDGLVSTRGLARLNAVHRILLDAEGLKLHGATSPDPDQETRPARNPVTLGRHLADQTGWLAPFVDSGIVWRDLNHAVAALAPDGGRDEYRAAAQVIIVELSRGIARLPVRRPAVEIGLSWDDPAATSCGGLVTSEGSTLAPQALLHEARETFLAFLECLAKTHPRGSKSSLPGVRVELSPYFFGAPEAGDVLERMGEIALGPIRLTIRYASPETELLPADDRVASPEIVAQHVSLHPVAFLAPGIVEGGSTDFVDRAVHAAADLHAAKHAWLERATARPDGAFGMLHGAYGRSRWLDRAAARFDVDVSDGTAGLGDEAFPNEVAQACARWAEALDFPLAAAGTGAAPTNVCQEPCDALAHLVRTAERYRAYVEPRPAAFRFRDTTEPGAVGDLIREAFLGTACRALLFM